MNLLLPLLYFTFFAVIAGGAFAMMWSNIQSINNPRKPQHPEAPKEGDELLYVDFNRDKLENLYNHIKQHFLTLSSTEKKLMFGMKELLMVELQHTIQLKVW